MARSQKRNRGRPPMPAESRKRNNLTMRLRDETRAALEERAAANGRSLSEEIEVRLEQSFDPALGGARTAALLRSLAAIVELEGYGDEWLDDRYAFNEVTDHWARSIDEQRRRLDPTDAEE